MYSVPLNLVKPGREPSGPEVSGKTPQCCALIIFTRSAVGRGQSSCGITELTDGVSSQ